MDPQNEKKYQEVISDLQKQNQKLMQWVNDLQSGMYVNCVYCGHRYGHKDETPVSMSEKLTEHIEICKFHPLNLLKKSIKNCIYVYDLDDGVYDYIMNQMEFYKSLIKSQKDLHLITEEE